MLLRIKRFIKILLINRKLKVTNNKVSLRGSRRQKGTFDPRALEGDVVGLENKQRANRRLEEGQLRILEKGLEYWFPAYCPHKGVPLIDGASFPEQKTIVCPAHRMKVGALNVTRS